ncbi:MAG: zinc ribbon domain-containing protein [Candidatus Krumholzibacteriota bacterium]|nr:zinc ribbon domain-containing protein [Candidatus Krumholzibacteriota bacterium]
MPIFEYECNKCGEKFEELVASPEQKVQCPACSSKSVEKQFSLFAGGKCDCSSSAGGG